MNDASRSSVLCCAPERIIRRASRSNLTLFGRSVVADVREKVGSTPRAEGEETKETGDQEGSKEGRVTGRAFAAATLAFACSRRCELNRWVTRWQAL